MYSGSGHELHYAIDKCGKFREFVQCLGASMMDNLHSSRIALACRAPAHSPTHTHPNPQTLTVWLVESKHKIELSTKKYKLMLCMIDNQIWSW